MVTNNSALGRSLIGLFLGSIVLTILIFSLLFFKLNAALAGIAFILALFYAGAVSISSRFGYYSFLVLSFLFPTIHLYSGFTQLGVLLDFILLITVVLLLAKEYNGDNQIEKHFFQYKSFWIWAVWAALSVIIQLINWQNVNWLSFIYGIRRHHLSPIGFILLNILFIQNKRIFKRVLLAHIFGAIFLALISERQMILGFNSFEENLLASPFGRMHLLPGFTRYWGGFTDAASNGVGLSLMILASLPFVLNRAQSKNTGWLYVAIILFIHSILLSGTRSAYASMGAGIIVITLTYVRPRVRLYLFSSFTILFTFLRFTEIGNSNLLIRRLRSVFDSQDGSLLVRIENREKLANWLISHPLGGGIGAVTFDKRFNSGSFLSSFPPDGLYVLMHAELGRYGQLLFFAVIGVTLAYMFINTVKAPSYTDTKLWMSTCLALFVAARISDYAQMTTFQFPLVNILFLTMVGFEKWEKWPAEVIFTPKESAPFN